jgi:hypothetical protein
MVHVEVHVAGEAGVQQGKLKAGGFRGNAKQDGRVGQIGDLQGHGNAEAQAVAGGMVEETLALQEEEDILVGDVQGQEGSARNGRVEVEEKEDEEGDVVPLKTPDQSDGEGTSPKGGCDSGDKSARLLSKAVEKLKPESGIEDVAAAPAAGDGAVQPVTVIHLALRSAVAAAIAGLVAAAAGYGNHDLMVGEILAEATAAGGQAGSDRKRRGGGQVCKKALDPGVAEECIQGVSLAVSATATSSIQETSSSSSRFVHGEQAGSKGLMTMSSSGNVHPPMADESSSGNDSSSIDLEAEGSCDVKAPQPQQQPQRMPNLWGGLILLGLLVVTSGASGPGIVATAAAARGLGSGRRWRREVQCAA